MKPTLWALFLCLLVGCSRTPTDWTGPALVLPKAEQAFALAVRDTLMVPSSLPEDDLEDLCEEPHPKGLPDALLKPAVVSITMHEIRWMDTMVASLEDGLIPGGLALHAAIPGLLEAANASRMATRHAYSACGVESAHRRHAIPLLAMDVRVPAKTLMQIFYTLGQALFGEFAYLVEDPTPILSRADAPIGGIKFEGPGEPYPNDQQEWLGNDATEHIVGSLLVANSSYGWMRRETPAVHFPKDAPLPKNLLEVAPPRITLTGGPHTPFGALASAQDALAEAGVFCVLPVVSRESHGDVQNMPTSVPSAPPKAAKLAYDGMMSVHLVEPPKIGGLMLTRRDGSRCSKVVFLEPRVPDKDPPAHGGLRGLSRGPKQNVSDADLLGSLSGSRGIEDILEVDTLRSLCMPYLLWGWTREAEVWADLNKDGNTDAAVVVAAPKPKEKDEPPDRMLVIGLGDERGEYTRTLSTACLALCQTCGGILGDPFKTLELHEEHGLKIVNAGGSREQWEAAFTIAWHEGGFKVVAFESSSHDTRKRSTDEHIKINLLTGLSQKGTEAPKKHSLKPISADDCDAIEALRLSN